MLFDRIIGKIFLDHASMTAFIAMNCMAGLSVRADPFENTPGSAA
jgi:hypothetical protein